MQRVLMLVNGTNTRSFRVVQDAGLDAFVIVFCRHLQTSKLLIAEARRCPPSWQLRRKPMQP